MQTLISEDRSWIKFTGLPGDYRIMRIVLNYCEGLSSHDEYREFYKSFSRHEKKTADDLVMYIEAALRKDRIKL